MATIYTESESVMSSQLLSDVQLYRMSMPDHECPWGLKAIELMQKRQIHFEDHRLTSQEQVDSFKQRYGVPTTPQIFSGTERIGGYSDLAALLGEDVKGVDYSYTPVIAVFGTALLMAIVLGDSMI